jgi:hypothetical protein
MAMGRRLLALMEETGFCRECIQEEELGLEWMGGPTLYGCCGDYEQGHLACRDDVCQCVDIECVRRRQLTEGPYMWRGVRRNAMVVMSRHYNWIRIVAVLAMRRANRHHPLKDAALRPDILGVIQCMAFGADHNDVDYLTRYCNAPTNVSRFCDTLFARAHCDSKKRTR